MANEHQPIHLYHRVLGDCILERTEGVIWIVRRVGEQTTYRIPPTRRNEFTRRCSDAHEVLASELVQKGERQSFSQTESVAVSRGPDSLAGQSTTAMPNWIPSKPQDVWQTAPELWCELESWVKSREELDTNHVVFCRRIGDACRAGRLLSPNVAHDARRMLKYALKRGFRSKYFERRETCPATRNENADMPRSAHVWNELAAWGRQTQRLSSLECEVCEFLAESTTGNAGVAARFWKTARNIFDNARQRGFVQIVDVGDRFTGEIERVGSDAVFQVEESDLERNDEHEPATSISLGTDQASRQDLDHADPRLLRRMIQSIRTGLPPMDGWGRSLTVGFEGLAQESENLFDRVEEHGGTLVVRGAYGQGKTFALNLLADLALESGFAVAHAEIDARENRLDRPDQIYRSLMANLRLPNMSGVGTVLLAGMVDEKLMSAQNLECDADVVTWRKNWLNSRVGCRPLAWLFSDPECLSNRYLMSLFAGDKSVTASLARQSHVRGGNIRDWPTFSYGTQGDVGSYLLAGVGRLCKLLEMKGLILIFDEMEKWQDLDWRAQERAGNLLGGLMWGATARNGQRVCRQHAKEWLWGGHYWKGCDHPDCLQHSGFAGGCHFTTEDSCHLGLAIAMTPRAENPPEEEWRQYGALDLYDLPDFDLTSVREYLGRITPVYQRAYGVQQTITEDVVQWAYRQWRDRGDRSARTGVAAVIESLDRWRDTIQVE